MLYFAIIAGLLLAVGAPFVLYGDKRQTLYGIALCLPYIILSFYAIIK